MLALNAYVPPKERRGLVLIDPPYEAPDEARRVEQRARPRAREMADAASISLWRPIRERADDAHFLNSIAALGAPNMLRLEIDVGPGPRRRALARSRSPARASSSSTRRTRFSGRRSCSFRVSTKLLARGGEGRFVCDWLTEPA